MSFFRYQFIEIGEDFFLSGRTVLHTRQDIPLVNIGTDPADDYFDPQTGTLRYKRICNPEFDKKADPGMENLPYILTRENAAQVVDSTPGLIEEHVSKAELYDALVGMKKGDSTKIDAIEQKVKSLKSK